MGQEAHLIPHRTILSAGVGLFTVIAVDTEVFSIIESPFVIPIRETVSSDFFRDCGRILAQESGNILKGSTRIQLVFDIDTVFKSKMFLVTRNIFTHYEPCWLWYGPSLRWES